MGTDRKEYMKEYYKKYKEKHKDTISQKKHEWYLNNHEKVKEYNAKYYREVTSVKRESEKQKEQSV